MKRDGRKISLLFFSWFLIFQKQFFLNALLVAKFDVELQVVHMGTYGCIWVHMGTYGYIWVHIGTYGWIPECMYQEHGCHRRILMLPTGMHRSSWPMADGHCPPPPPSFHPPTPLSSMRHTTYGDSKVWGIIQWSGHIIYNMRNTATESLK